MTQVRLQWLPRPLLLRITTPTTVLPSVRQPSLTPTWSAWRMTTEGYDSEKVALWSLSSSKHCTPWVKPVSLRASTCLHTWTTTEAALSWPVHSNPAFTTETHLFLSQQPLLWILEICSLLRSLLPLSAMCATSVTTLGLACSVWCGSLQPCPLPCQPPCPRKVSPLAQCGINPCSSIRQVQRFNKLHLLEPKTTETSSFGKQGRQVWL